MRTTKHMQNIMMNGRSEEREATAMHLLANLDEYLPWLAARTLDGLTLTHKQSDWLLVIKATRGTKKQVAFVGGDHPGECFEVAAHMLLFDLITWKADKFSTMRSDKK